MNAAAPLRLAIINDFEIVVKGLVLMLEPYAGRVTVVEAVANARSRQPADIVIYDSFSQTHAVDTDLESVLSNTNAHRLVIYSWNLDPGLVRAALEQGACGYLAKGLPADELVEALERIHAGEVVVTEHDLSEESNGGDWPGRQHGLTTRESEIIALITQGLSNQQIADRAFLSINSVKSYIRSSYRKMGVTSRSRAVLWGIENGFRPDHAPEKKSPAAQL